MIPGEYFIDEGDIEFNSQLLKPLSQLKTLATDRFRLALIIIFTK